MQPTSKGGAPDYRAGALYINTLKNGGVGIIVLQKTITIYPISLSMKDWHFDQNIQVPFVTTPKGPMRKSARSNTQRGAFDINITPKTFWKE